MPEVVGRPPTEDQQSAERQCVGGDDPLRGRGREAQLGAESQQRDVDDAEVEHDHQGRAQDHRQPESAEGQLVDEGGSLPRHELSMHAPAAANPTRTRKGCAAPLSSTLMDLVDAVGQIDQSDPEFRSETAAEVAR